MNGRYLLITLLLMVTIGVVVSTRSTLTPERGVDHVFYANISDFMAQELTVGDFNGDGLDDVVATLLWDDPNTCNAPPGFFSNGFACDPARNWTRWVAVKAGEDTTICGFTDSTIAQGQWDYWVGCEGWTVIDTLGCGECWQAEWTRENNGAAYVFMGGDWSGKPRDFDLTAVSPDHQVLGANAGDKIYNGLGAGDLDADGRDELVLGAPQDTGAGEAYVIAGGTSWPTTINPPTDALIEHVFLGRTTGDAFGLGIVVGDLNADGKDDVVVAAPRGDGIDSLRSNSGEVYIFYSVSSLPASVDLSSFAADTTMLNSTAAYLQVIYGATESDSIGVTLLKELHEGYPGHAAHGGGNYEPVGLAIGNWNGDAYNDLAIGAGHAENGAGAVYVIFGADPEDAGTKLRPGNTMDLANAPTGSGENAPDVKIVGNVGSRLGAGVEFVDADGEGPAGQDAGKDDLIIGAPYAVLGGDSLSFEYHGEVYIIFGDDREVLTAVGEPDGARDWTDVDVTILGQEIDDQLGGHFAGDLDVDDDDKNDIGIAGQDAVYVLFGQSRADWDSAIDLSTVLEADPKTRVLKWIGEPLASSTTIKFARLDDDEHDDLVFGGYDLPGKGNQVHAGQMWITKGADLWKRGLVDDDATWSGNVFVHGDITVAPGQTLTIEAGTDVWIWPRDPDSSDEPWSGYSSQVDSTVCEIRVWGQLEVNGTEDEPVRFLAWTTDSVTTDQRDAWWGIHVHDTTGAGAVIDHCIIRNARYGLQANANVTIRNSTIEHCDVLGLSVAGGDSVYADSLTIHDVGYIGVNMNTNARVRLQDCNLYNLGDYGVKAYSGARLYANATTITDADIEAIALDGEDTFADIDDCVLNDSYRGLRVENDAVATIDGSTLDGNDNYSVFTLYDGALAVIDCSIMNSTAGVAAYESNPILIENLIRDNEVGLLALQGSFATVEDCDIIYNDIGVLAMQGGNPNLGTGSSYGSNEIHHSTTYHVSNLSSGVTVKAENNYWKNAISPCWPTPSKINGSVDYLPSVCSPPSVSYRLVESEPLPVTFGLSQNYPNPFNPTTSIPYAVPSPGGDVKIAVFNVRGQLVRTLVNGAQSPGYHRVQWDGRNNGGNAVSTGVYFVLMRAGAFQQTRKLVLLK